MHNFRIPISLHMYFLLFDYCVLYWLFVFIFSRVMWTYKNTQQIQQTMIEEQKPHWYLDAKKYVARLLNTMFIILSSFHILCNRMEGRRNINVRHSRGMIRTKEKTVHGKKKSIIRLISLFYWYNNWSTLSRLRLILSIKRAKPICLSLTGVPISIPCPCFRDRKWDDVSVMVRDKELNRLHIYAPPCFYFI